MNSQNMELTRIILRRITGGDIASSIIIIIFLLMLIAYLIYVMEYPKDSILMGERWKYKSNLEPSESHVKHTKVMAKVLLAVCIVTIITVLVSIII